MPFRYVFVFLLALAAAWAAILEYPSAGDEQVRVLLEEDTLYHHVLITQRTEEGGHAIRCMKFTGKTPTNQSCIDLNDPARQVLEYSEMCFAGLLFDPNPRSVLVIGLGGGVVPKIFNEILPATRVDVVEIDKRVASLCAEFFDYIPRATDSLTIQDGRRYVSRNKKKYDLVVLDAFTGDQIPFHLMTAEFFELLKKNALAPNGVLVSNVFFHTELFSHQMATYHHCFSGVYPFKGERSGNVIVVASSRSKVETKDALLEKGRELQEKNRRRFFDMSRVAGFYEPGIGPGDDAKVMTDDYAPVNTLMRKKR